MNKKDLEIFSKNLENLLREEKYIENRDKLLDNMFGECNFLNSIKSYFFKNSIFDYFFIGKILFFTSLNVEITKNKKNFINFLKDKKYIIITNNFTQEELENKLKEFFHNNHKNYSTKDLDWEDTFKKIKNLEVDIKSQDDSTYFNFKNINNFKNILLSEIITQDFEVSCKLIFDSKKNNYQKDKLKNALFLKELTKFIKKRSTLDNLLDLSKDKVGDFKIISKNENLRKDWDNLSWSEIKEIKKEI